MKCRNLFKADLFGYVGVFYAYGFRLSSGMFRPNPIMLRLCLCGFDVMQSRNAFAIGICGKVYFCVEEK